MWLYAAMTRLVPSEPCSAAGSGSRPPRASRESDQGKVIGWDIDNAWNLPAARDDAAGYTANGTLYIMGGADNEGPRPEVYWSIPASDGTILEWTHLQQSDSPYGLTGASAFVTGPNAVLAGGETADAVLQTSLRANTAPQAPFFQLGPFGATVPGLKHRR